MRKTTVTTIVLGLALTLGFAAQGQTRVPGASAGKPSKTAGTRPGRQIVVGQQPPWKEEKHTDGMGRESLPVCGMAAWQLS